MKSLLCAFAIVCLSSYATMATALPTETDALPKVVVDYGDLNLQDMRGVKALYARLQRTADVVCKTYEVNPRDLARARAYQTCRTEALAHAVADVKSPLLNHYAAQRQKVRQTRVAQN
jgi:UrcA family protein